MSRGRRALRRMPAMALLWSVVLFAFLWTLNFHRAFGMRQALMEEARAEAAGGMAGIELRDPAAWEASERRIEARIGEMRTARHVTGTALVLVPLAGAAATLWMLRRRRRESGTTARIAAWEHGGRRRSRGASGV
jgi:hypothetical protein